VVAAFARLAAAHPDLTLTVLGPGRPDAAVLDDFPATLRPRVRCVSARAEADLAAVYAGHDVYLLPSLFEGTPLTLIEAMLSGLPVVTTATCGMKDVVRDGANGLLVPTHAPDAVGAAVGRLLGDEGLRRRLGGAAHAD